MKYFLAVDGWKCLWAQVGFTSYHESLLQIFRFLTWYNSHPATAPLNFQEIEFFVHQNVPSSLTVDIIMGFIHRRRNTCISS